MSKDNDTPIGKMVGDTLRKKIDGRMPPKRNDKAPAKPKRETINTGVRN